MNKELFDKALNALADEPFRYGKNDCFHFAARLVMLMHGKDYRHLHKYRSKAEAEEYIKKHGGIERLAEGTLGYPLRSTELAKDGDVVSAEVGAGQIALGFVANGKAWFKTKKRVIPLPIEACRKAWRIN